MIPLALPKQLVQHTGFHWCDEHVHRASRHQFKPFLQALAVMNPTVRANDIDIVVNRNMLQKPYNFASFKRGRAFYVDLDMVQNTIFISHWEAKARGQQQSGYGSNFKEAFTTEDLHPPLPKPISTISMGSSAINKGRSCLLCEDAFVF